MGLNLSLKRLNMLSDIRSISCSVIGSALFWTWGFAWALNPSIAHTSGDLMHQAYLVSMFAYILAALLVFFRFTDGKAVYSEKSVSVATAVVTTSTAFEAAMPSLSPFGPIATISAVAIGTVNGAGLLYLSIAWGSRYALLGRRASMVIGASFFLTFALNALTTLIPYPANAILIASCPAAAILLWKQLPQALEQNAHNEFKEKPNNGQNTSKYAPDRQREIESSAILDGEASPAILPWRTISVLSIVPFLASFFDAVRNGEANESTISPFLIASLLCLAYLTVLRVSKKQTNVTGSFLLLVPITTLALSLMMISNNAYLGWPEALLKGCAYLLHVVIWVQLAQVSINEGLAPLVAFGIGGISVTALQLTGSLTGAIMAASPFREEENIPFLAMISLMVLITSLVVLFYGKTNEEKQGHEPEDENASEIASTRKSVGLDLDQSIAEFAKKYGFSSRESEVFGYFAHGRNIPYIAERLFVTSGTVKSHSNHIFQKTGVANRQQLLDLFEKFTNERDDTHLKNHTK